VNDFLTPEVQALAYAFPVVFDASKVLLSRPCFQEFVATRPRASTKEPTVERSVPVRGVFTIPAKLADATVKRPRQNVAFITV
jgi:hypothetical protein